MLIFLHLKLLKRSIFRRLYNLFFANFYHYYYRRYQQTNPNHFVYENLHFDIVPHNLNHAGRFLTIYGDFFLIHQKHRHGLNLPKLAY